MITICIFLRLQARWDSGLWSELTVTVWLGGRVTEKFSEWLLALRFFCVCACPVMFSENSESLSWVKIETFLVRFETRVLTSNRAVSRCGRKSVTVMFPKLQVYGQLYDQSILPCSVQDYASAFKKQTTTCVQGVRGFEQPVFKIIQG